MRKKISGIPIVFLGFATAAAFWVMEAFVHAFILDAEGFIEALLYPDPNELWMRLLLVSIIVGASFYASSIVKRLKLSEAALRKERDRAQNYFDIAGVIFIITGADGRVMDINQKGCEILGLDKTQVIGRDWIERFVPEKDREDVRKVFSDLIAGKVDKAAYHENLITSITLGERSIAWQNIPLADENGAVWATLSSGMDITERRRAEEALKESEEKYRLMVNESNDIICVHDLSGAISFVNRRFEELSGFAFVDIKEKEIDPFIVEKDLQTVKQALKKVVSGEKTGYEAQVLKKDGSILFLSINAAPIWKDGTVAGMVSFSRDITNERAATAELKERVIELERFMKATIDRELRMKELSDELKRLKEKKEVPSTGRPY